MGPSDAISILVIVILLILSAFFSSSETALTTVNKIKMRSLADEKNKSAKQVLKLIEEPEKMLSAILICNSGELIRFFLFHILCIQYLQTDGI